MKILLNGATGGTNFGDFLFAKIFQEVVAEKVGLENVFWYESRYCLSDFYKEHLHYDQNKKYKLKDIDALICISGGYFCGDDHSLRDYIIRYLRYFHLCLKCIVRKIPIAIIGVEVAKPKLKLMEWIEKYILKKADLLIVRNNESYQQLLRYGIQNGICTVDTAHTITPELYENIDVDEKIKTMNGKKLFVHVQLSSIQSSEKILPVLNEFLRKHSEYSVVIGLDQYVNDVVKLYEFSDKIVCSNKVVYRYQNPIALCKVLSLMDLIVTPKLHVGIVGATMSKSVISFSNHTEKISRFYAQLNESERSLSMANYDDKVALQILETYFDKPIYVPQEIIEKSFQNLDYLNKFIDRVSCGSKDSL